VIFTVETNEAGSAYVIEIRRITNARGDEPLKSCAPGTMSCTGHDDRDEPEQLYYYAVLKHPSTGAWVATSERILITYKWNAR
jgi:hypothetical protein